VVTMRAKARCIWVWSRFPHVRGVGEWTVWFGFDTDCSFFESDGIHLEGVIPSVPYLINSFSIEPVDSSQYVLPRFRSDNLNADKAMSLNY